MMLRIIVVAAVLSLGTAAHGAGPKPAQKGKSSTVDAKRTLMNAKRALKAAFDLCGNPGKCEPDSRNADREYLSMLEDADRNFIEACLACSTAEKCDAERDRMKEGKRSPGTQPCE